MKGRHSWVQGRGTRGSSLRTALERELKVAHRAGQSVVFPCLFTIYEFPDNFAFPPHLLGNQRANGDEAAQPKTLMRVSYISPSAGQNVSPACNGCVSCIAEEWFVAIKPHCRRKGVSLVERNASVRILRNARHSLESFLRLYPGPEELN